MATEFDYGIEAQKPFWRVEVSAKGCRVCLESMEADITLRMSKEALRRLLRAGNTALATQETAFVTERGELFRHAAGDKDPVQITA